MNTKRLQYYFAVPVLLFLFSQSVFSQLENIADDWRWIHFSTESGLLSENVISILETSNGTIWALTGNGVCRFDGFEWIPLELTSPEMNSKVTSLRPWQGDSVLIGFNDGSFVCYRGMVRKISSVSECAVLPDGSSSFLSIEQMNLLKNQNGVRNTVQPEITENRTVNLWQPESKNLWVSLTTGLLKWKDDSLHPVLLDSSEQFRVRSLGENDSGVGIVAITMPMSMQGLWEWSPGVKPMHNLTERGYQLQCLDIAPNGDAIAVYESGEVRIRHNGSWASPGHVPKFLQESKFVRFTSNGDLWVASMKGIFLLRLSFSQWSHPAENTLSLRNNINDIFKARDGSVWLGTGDGIEIHHPDSPVEWISEINGVRLYGVTGISDDHAGNIWIVSGSTFTGAYRLEGKRWTHFDIGAHPEINRFHKIKKDRKGNLWFLGLASKGSTLKIEQPGVYCYNDTQFVAWGDSQNLPNKRVYAFAESKTGALWFGTFNGLHRWKNGVWKSWGVENGLKMKRVFTVAIDSNDITWFGDQDWGGGIGYINADDEVRYFTTLDGLINDNVWDISVDTSGGLWIATNGGVSHYKEGRWITYGEKTGLTCPFLWPILPTSNRIYVGTRGKGLMVLRPNSSMPPSPRVLIDKPLVQRAATVLRWLPRAYYGELPSEEILTRYRIDNMAWSEWSTTKSLRLEDLEPRTYTVYIQAKGLYGQYDSLAGQITFFVPPPLFRQPEFYIPIGMLCLALLILGSGFIIRKRKADAILKKSEEKFRTVTETTPSAVFIIDRSKILFVNPAALQLLGYSLQDLSAKNFLDLMVPEYHQPFQNLQYRVTVDEAALHTFEAQFLTSKGEVCWVELTIAKITFQGIIATLIATYNITERKQNEQKLRTLAAELSKAEDRERKQMAIYLHDYISQNLAFCKLKLRGVQKAIDEEPVLRQLSEIQSLVENLIKDSQTLTFELSSPVLSELGLDSAIEWLVEQIQQKHLLQCRFTVDKLPKPLSREMETLMFTIARELLVNVVKHAEAKAVRVSLRRRNNECVLSVVDDGKGFSVEEEQQQDPKTRGFGMFSIRERLTYMGGTMEVQSLPGHGTRVTVAIPVNESEIKELL